jgi:hypothetical protein
VAGLFYPGFDCVYRPASLSPNFLTALAQRIEASLFPMMPARQNAYFVTSQTDDALKFQSRNFLTGITWASTGSASQLTKTREK